MNNPIPQPRNTPPRVGVLISGSGTTLQNLADLAQCGELPISIACVISSRNDAYGLTRAAALNIPAHVVPRRSCLDLDDFSTRIYDLLKTYTPDLICLAGFLSLWKIPPEYQWRTLNIHPALLPKFGGRSMHGLHVHEAVIQAGETQSGCTVHFADNQYDHGPIILQRTCPVLPDDTPQTLAARVFDLECRAYPQAIQLWVNGRLTIAANGQVRVK
ncbi:MAG: phosphoribosylglycinamide formyltransferase [Phycisphaerae bacterium]|nr:phosphoribosylglycinamide formyltransferase [Phycisphaerae bacterium]